MFLQNYLKVCMIIESLVCNYPSIVVLFLAKGYSLHA